MVVMVVKDLYQVDDRHREPHEKGPVEMTMAHN